MEVGQRAGRLEDLAEDKFLDEEGNLFRHYPIEDNQNLAAPMAPTPGESTQTIAETRRPHRGNGRRRGGQTLDAPSVHYVGWWVTIKECAHELDQTQMLLQ